MKKLFMIKHGLDDAMEIVWATSKQKVIFYAKKQGYRFPKVIEVIDLNTLDRRRTDVHD